MIFLAGSAKRRSAPFWGSTDWTVSAYSDFCPAGGRPLREVSSGRQPFFSASAVFSLPLQFCRFTPARRSRRTHSGTARGFRTPVRRRPLSGIPSRGAWKFPGCRSVSRKERRGTFSPGMPGRFPYAGQAGLCGGRLRLSCRVLFQRCLRRGSRSVSRRASAFRSRGAARTRAPLPGPSLCPGRRGAFRL